MRIVPLSEIGHDAVEALLDAAFGRDRFGRTAYRIRTGMRELPELSLALLADDGALIGTLQSWPVALTDARGISHPLVMVGPVAVAPAHQGTGHGRALMDAVMDRAHAIGADPLMMIGDPDYYGRFWGFTAEGTGEWDVPGPVERHRLLVHRLGRAVALPARGALGPRGASAAYRQAS